MAKKCCVYGCSTNFSSQKKILNESKTSVFRFPRDKKRKHTEENVFLVQI